MKRIFLVVASVLIAACATTATPSVQPPPDASQLPVDPGNRAELERCMAAAGYTVHPARTGSNAVYSWERSSYFTWEPDDGPVDQAAAQTCREKYGDVRKTEPEIREIYDRWVLERACLVGLGFRPRPAPPFAEFLADWDTGPWMPIDGIDYDRITQEAKDLCGLEMTP